ncbi:MAG TPA: dTDP-4-dehydrorhamnose 3,5-epimerase family protein [Acidimicrobiales bacterium]|nr:dTDP-4-dehydrorhamnose 3,5-epimerase family protein [Acidimicrobiales bacterium]
MKVTALSIPGAYVLDSAVWGDDRGFFREWFKRPDLDALGISFAIEQANLSMSRRGVVRGLHYSIAPEGQAKLVTCAYGELDDVIVDVRVGSPAFGRVEVVQLAANEERSVLLPAGTAHGFCVRSEHAALSYLLSSPFNPEMELEINPFDEALDIPWRLKDPAIMSDKDAQAPSLSDRVAAGQLPTYLDVDSSIL